MKKKENNKNFEVAKYFLSGQDNVQRKFFYGLIDACFDFLNGKERQEKVLIYKNWGYFRRAFGGPLPQKGMDQNKLLKSLRSIGKYSISQSDLGYLAFPDSGNSVAGLMAEVYSKFLNQNLIAFDRSAPAATFVEIQLIEWLRELIGYHYKKPGEIRTLAEVSGMWTTGGHMSNHIAVMAALNKKYPQIKTDGLAVLDHQPQLLLAGKISHYSYSAAMHHLGLGNENIISVKSNEDFTTNIEDLEKVLREHQEKSDIFMVVAVAGNCRTSSIDNLSEIAKICKKYGVWLHADACHGGSLLFSDRLKNKYLKGINETDSVSLDPHKGLFVTYPCSYVIFKQRDTLVKFTRYEEQVRNGEAWDLGYVTPFFGSRGFESLKIWLLIKHLGRQGLARVVEKRNGDAKFAEDLIKRSGYFTLFNEMSFYRLVFVYYPERIKKKVVEKKVSPEVRSKIKNCIDFYTHKINAALYEEGNVCLDEFKLHDIGNSTGIKTGEDRFYVMSITIGNPLYTKESLKKSLDYLFSKAEHYLAPMEKDITKILDNEQYGAKVSKSYGPAGWQ